MQLPDWMPQVPNVPYPPGAMKIFKRPGPIYCLDERTPQPGDTVHGKAPRELQALIAYLDNVQATLKVEDLFNKRVLRYRRRQDLLLIPALTNFYGEGKPNWLRIIGKDWVVFDRPLTEKEKRYPNPLILNVPPRH